MYVTQSFHISGTSLMDGGPTTGESSHGVSYPGSLGEEKPLEGVMFLTCRERETGKGQKATVLSQGD